MTQETYKQRMERYDKMPDAIQELSRKYGNVVDELYDAGCSRDDIIKELTRIGRI